MDITVNRDAFMKVDLFMEFPSPPGHDRGPEGALHDGIAIARAAESAGIDAVWLAEHHFLGDYCNLAAPDMLLAAIARETNRLQLGFGILPLPIHDPVRVAERLATLDILSAGRVLWGVGRGVTVCCVPAPSRATGCITNSGPGLRRRWGAAGWPASARKASTWPPNWNSTP
jgi:hypothetical protein